MDNTPLRVIIRVRVTDIPGDPLGRVYRLGCDFSEEILGRPLETQGQAGCNDAMHFLPNFDSRNAVNAWFIYDFNFIAPLEKEELRTIPHKVYLATRQDNSWIFTPRDGWVHKAKEYCSMYRWGGQST